MTELSVAVGDSFISGKQSGAVLQDILWIPLKADIVIFQNQVSIFVENLRNTISDRLII